MASAAGGAASTIAVRGPVGGAPNMRTGTNQSTDIGRTETIAAQAQRAHPGDTRPPHQAVYRKGWFARPCRLPPPRTPDQLRTRWTVKDRLITISPTDSAFDPE